MFKDAADPMGLFPDLKGQRSHLRSAVKRPGKVSADRAGVFHEIIGRRTADPFRREGQPGISGEADHRCTDPGNASSLLRPDGDKGRSLLDGKGCRKTQTDGQRVIPDHRRLPEGEAQKQE